MRFSELELSNISVMIGGEGEYHMLYWATPVEGEAFDCQGRAILVSYLFVKSWLARYENSSYHISLAQHVSHLVRQTGKSAYIKHSKSIKGKAEVLNKILAYTKPLRPWQEEKRSFTKAEIEVVVGVLAT